MSTILIADDTVADIELLLLAFSEKNVDATFRTAHDGREALDILELVRPDLVLLDIKMPKVGGLQVLEALRQRSDLRAVPVIIMSSSKAEKDVAQALALGALRYWQKASLFTDILALVQTLLEVVPALGGGHREEARPSGIGVGETTRHACTTKPPPEAPV